MTDDQNSQKMLVDCTHIVDIDLGLTRRIYSTVDVFTVICMRNNGIVLKNYHLSLPIPFRKVHKQRIKLTGLDHSEQRRKSISIHRHAQNHEPLPSNINNQCEKSALQNIIT